MLKIVACIYKLRENEETFRDGFAVCSSTNETVYSIVGMDGISIEGEPWSYVLHHHVFCTMLVW